MRLPACCWFFTSSIYLIFSLVKEKITCNRLESKLCCHRAETHLSLSQVVTLTFAKIDLTVMASSRGYMVVSCAPLVSEVSPFPGDSPNFLLSRACPAMAVYKVM